MGRFTLIARLVAQDLQRRPGQAALLLLVIMAATTTLTLGLALSGVTSHPYQQTKAATAGPDVVVSYGNLPPMPAGATPVAALAAMSALARAPGVTAVGGPYPIGWATLRAGELTAGVMAEGRAPAPSAVDQPRLVDGSWVSPGGVVVERSFADALGVRVGERVTLDGRLFRVAGIAVSAANAQFPNADFLTRGNLFGSSQCGMVWVTAAAARAFATKLQPLSFVLNLRLADSSAAPAFAAARSSGEFQALNVIPWQQIAREDNNLVVNEQRILLVGSWLLGVIAVASVAVIVGGRLAEQTRRVGLLKAVGGTPGLVAVMVLAENLLFAVAAAGAGLSAGWLAAPLLTNPGSGLVGTPGPPSLTLITAGWVAALAVAVAMLATFVPALRAARTSTVGALGDAALRPRRHRVAVRVSRRLPVPLLLGLRLAARRPRRSILGVVSVFITQATAADARHSAALVRALGATREQVTAALCAAQLIPAVPGVLLGIPAGIGLVRAVRHGQNTTVPPAWWLITMAVGVLVVLAMLVAVPARLSARRAPAEILAAESVTG
jgi:putative ABC transport system permease protein